MAKLLKLLFSFIFFFFKIFEHYELITLIYTVNYLNDCTVQRTQMNRGHRGQFQVVQFYLTNNYGANLI